MNLFTGSDGFFISFFLLFSLKVPINVEETFNLYLDVFSTSKVGENEISMKNGSTARHMIFSPRTMFNLLNLAYPAYSKRMERHCRYNTLNTRKALEETTYRKSKFV